MKTKGRSEVRKEVGRGKDGTYHLVKSDNTTSRMYFLSTW